MRNAVLAGVVLAVSGLLLAGMPAAQASAPVSVPVSVPVSARATTVQLMTGQWVRVSSDHGRQVARSLSPDRRGIAGQLQMLRAGGHLYVIPGAARRYLGRSLDPRLFDLDLLARTERNGRVPLRVSFAGATAHPVPGVSAGRLTSPAAFGQALVAQWKADARPGAHPSGRLFGDVTRIDLAVPALPPVRPAYPQVTLIIKVTDPLGKPVDGEVDLINAEDSSRFVGFLPVVHGEARASVPRGDYSGLTSYDTYDPASDTVKSYLMSVGDYRVTTDRQTLRITARGAARLRITTPRPAVTDTLSAEWFRSDTVGGGLDSSFEYIGGAALYVTPTPQVHVGGLNWLTGWSMHGTPTGGLPYSYDASFAETGHISADQTHRITDAQTAVLDSRYYTDGPTRDSEFSRAPVYPFQFFVFSQYEPLSTPQHRIEYVVGGKGAVWADSLLADPTDDDPFAGEVDDGFRSDPAGSVRQVDWMRGALAPAVATPTNGEPQWTCYSCRTAKAVTVSLAPVTDSVPGHAGSVSVPSIGHAARFRIYRNGALLGDEWDSTGDTFRVPATAATYRVIDNVRRDQDGFVGSTNSTVDVTFRSAGGALPHGWDCAATGPGSCTVLPILQAHLPLPTDLNGTLRRGMSITAFSVDHVPGAPRSAIRSASLQLSFDGGRTWHNAPVFSLGGGQFRAVLINPASAAGHRVGVRVQATDALGGALSETVLNAYAVSSS